VRDASPVVIPFLRRVLLLQGGFYVATGVWPLLHMPSFEWITGPKVDDWLVYTVGLLLTVIGIALAVSGWRRRAGPALWIVAIGTPLAIAGIELVHVAIGRISRVYLLDAVIELAFALALAMALAAQKRTA
jgi:hypothetical protein